MAWSSGAGWGLFLTYSTYFRNHDAIGTNAATVVIGDSTVGILAAMIVIPGIFLLLQILSRWLMLLLKITGYYVCGSA